MSSPALIGAHGIGSGSFEGASSPLSANALTPGQASSGLPARNSRKRRRLSVLILDSSMSGSLSSLQESVNSRAGGLDHRRPLGDFGLDEVRELFRRVARKASALGRQPRLNLR